MNKSIIAALTLALASSSVPAVAALSVTASMDSTEMLMGSQTRLEVKVSYPLADTAKVQLLNFPRFNATTPGQYYDMGDYDLVGLSLDSTVSNQDVMLTFDYVLQAFDPGNVDIMPFVAVDGAGDTVRSRVLPLKVFEVPVDTVSMAAMPADGVVSANNPWYDYIPLWLFWTIAAIIVIAGAVILVVLHRKKKLPIFQAKPKPVIPPFELAIRNLEELRREGLATSGNEKQFYTRLVDILRVYLHGRFSINAMEMTSTQIVKALRNNPDTRLSADQMKEVLRMADFVKFAKERPLADDNQRSLNQAFDFVNSTRPVPVTEETADEASPSSRQRLRSKTRS